MTDYQFIAPTELRDYAKSQGWTLTPGTASHRIYAMNHARFPRRQLVFPMDVTAADYSEAVAVVLEKLADLEGRAPEAIVSNVVEVGDDALAFRVVGARVAERAVPLTFAAKMLDGAQKMLLASACTALKPRIHHPRLSGAEAQQFLNSICFRHTQPGSFILNVSCPVHALDVSLPTLFGEGEVPFVRQATFVVMRSLRTLVAAIETDSMGQMLESMKGSSTPGISSNFCDALMCFAEEALKNSLEFSIRWAGSIARPADEPAVSYVRVQHDYFPHIEEARRALRSADDHVDDVFIGTVERLDGEIGTDGQRSGSVVLSVLLPEGEQVRVRANLDTEQYKYADQAHMTEGTYVKLSGRLHPGRQPRQLSNLQSFELIETKVQRMETSASPALTDDKKIKFAKKPKKRAL